MLCCFSPHLCIKCGNFFPHLIHKASILSSSKTLEKFQTIQPLCFLFTGKLDCIHMVLGVPSLGVILTFNVYISVVCVKPRGTCYIMFLKNYDQVVSWHERILKWFISSQKCFSCNYIDAPFIQEWEPLIKKNTKSPTPVNMLSVLFIMILVRMMSKFLDIGPIIIVHPYFKVT